MPNAVGTPADSDGSKTVEPVTNPHALPESIGPYRIIECIGEGGMGVVYKAEQREPVRRIVALKVIKLGMDTKEVVARFEAERQALAMMSHPNVAKVFDAGVTQTGRPYFAMEFVAGVSITNYCDTHKLNTKERLELFIPVCQAVQHAHQKGIIHRDLKPGNILITLFDGKPVPKVIDFGVAKATNFNLTDKTLFTHMGIVLGTVEYMSPEQAASSGLDVDTRTDIYSLGVILYQLMTGTLPFESETLRKAGVEARARIIRETDPRRPSTRITGSRVSADGGREPDPAEIAKRHNTDPSTLRRELMGDLDWIVLKAIEKDRTRRYETANGLARDIQRHLDNEPVSACPPSTSYRLSKFTRRHRLGMTAAALILMALLIGLAAASYGLVRANAASAEAKRLAKIAQDQTIAADEAASRAEQVSGFLQDLLSKYSSEAIRRTPKQTLDDVSREIQSGRLRVDPAAESRARAAIARSYIASSFYQPAIQQLRAVLVLKERQYGSGASQTVSTLNELADALVTDNDLAEAEELSRKALSIEQKMPNLDPGEQAFTMDLLGSAVAGQDKWDEAEPLFNQAFKIREAMPGETRGLADSYTRRADLLLHHDPHDPAGLDWLRKAREMYGRVFTGQPPTAMLGVLRRMARSAAQRGDWQMAHQMLPPRMPASDPRFLRERVNTLSHLLDSKPDDVELLRSQGAWYGRLGQFDLASSDFARILQLSPKDAEAAEAWHRWLPLLLQTKQFDLYIRKRRDTLQQFQSNRTPEIMHAIAKSCLCYPLEGEDLKIAWNLADGALRLQPTNAFFLQSMGMAEYRAGHFGKAVDYLAKSRDHVYAYRDTLDDLYLAMAQMSLGNRDQARTAFDAANQLWDSAIPKPGRDDLEQFEDWVLCFHARQEAEGIVSGARSAPASL